MKTYMDGEGRIEEQAEFQCMCQHCFEQQRKKVLRDAVAEVGALAFCLTLGVLAGFACFLLGEELRVHEQFWRRNPGEWLDVCRVALFIVSSAPSGLIMIAFLQKWGRR